MSTPFADALRNELMRSIREPPRRRRPPMAAVVVGLTALAVGLVAVVNPGTAAADVEITRQGGRVQVLLTDLRTSAGEVREALAEEHLNVFVEEAPVGPSNIGRFVGETTTADDVTDIQRVREVGVAFMGFSIPDDWDGTLTVLLGRPARGDERYELFSDAYAPGEPLACTGTLGHPLAAAVTKLEGFDVTVRRGDGTPGAPTDLETALGDGGGDLIITGGLALSADDVLMTVASSAEDVPEEPTC